MRYIAVLVLVFILISPLFAQAAHDKWPVAYGTLVDSAPTHNIYVAFYDDNASAYQRQLVSNDFDGTQFSPQRTGWGWDTQGKWGYAAIEMTSYDIEYWESPDVGWQDDAGAWAMTDDDNTYNYDECDVESRQNVVWILTRVAATGLLPIRLDLGVGVPAMALSLSAAAPVVPDDGYWSFCLDKNLPGNLHTSYVTTNLRYAGIPVTDNIYSELIEASDATSQIVTAPQNVWCFYTQSDDLRAEYKGSNTIGTTTTWFGDGTAAIIYAGTTLDPAFHATWSPVDDTLHVILIDNDAAFPNTTYNLIYLRRDPNGWSSAITIDSWVLGIVELEAPLQDERLYPQITVDALSNICVYYVEVTAGVPPTGDLRRWYLDEDDYDGFATPANWTQTTNIDNSAADILWCSAPDFCPAD